MDAKDQKFNHCLQKEIVALEKLEKKSELLTEGMAPIGTPMNLFIKYMETRTFRDYSIHSFVDRNGSIVTLYGTVKNTPVKIEDIEIGDCVEVTGKIAKYGHWNNNKTTRISHVKINENKGKRK